MALTVSDQENAVRAERAYARIPHSHQLAHALYKRGALTGLSVDAKDVVYARVRASGGGKSYGVWGSLETGRLFCACTWGSGCKHMGVVLLAVMRRGELGAAPAGDAAATQVAAWLKTFSGPRALPDGERVAFRVDLAPGNGFISLATQRRTPAGSWGAPRAVSAARGSQIVNGEVGERALLAAIETVAWNSRSQVRLCGRRGATALTSLLCTKRLFLVDAVSSLLLSPGDPIVGELGWRNEAGMQVPSVRTDSAVELLPLVPLHYLNRQTGCAGVVQIDADPELPMQWLVCPPVPVARAPEFARALAELAPSAPLPKTMPVDIVRGSPRGVLRLVERPPPPWGTEPVRWAELSFRYGEVLLPSGAPENPYLVHESDRIRQIEREPGSEQALRESLTRLSFACAIRHDLPLAERLMLPSVREWLFFLAQGVASLRATFDIIIEPAFTLDVIDSAEWFTELEASDNGWFDVELGVRVGDERISLLPLIVQALSRGLTARHDFFLELPDGRNLLVPYERVAPLADLILELAAQSPKDRAFRLPRLQSLDLAVLLRDESATLDSLRKLRAELLSLSALKKLKLPRSFKAELRAYQADGVAWLNLLGRVGLGALLADDMGLGKTVQIIALLCTLYTKPRAPSLVVAPTSVLLSWREQLARFAPRLDVVIWHGAGRFGQRSRMMSAHVVLTSYSLLWRDADELQGIEWDLCVLDEAQMIKNAKTVFAEKARELRARQRIALSGTPIENHLGELWSIMSFALPGALGSERAFRTAYRTPIEKAKDTERLAGLRRRLAPVLLRRTKEEVAAELPAKTTIEHPVDLNDAQRDLYETIRASVAKRVRDEIAKRGIAKSQIILLDALLKLRQVCCDPRLLKVMAAKRRAPSAKLEAFEQLIETLVQEGRKVLVFSQFVEMLDLLAQSLGRLRIGHSLLTGKTRDRAGAVAQFQTGSVPRILDQS